MHQYVFFVALVVLYVYRFDEVCGNVSLAPAEKLNFWARDAKYEARAGSLHQIHRRILKKQRRYRLHSAQRRWERQQHATAMDNLNRLWNDPVFRRHMRNHSHGPNHRPKNTSKPPRKLFDGVIPRADGWNQLRQLRQDEPTTESTTTAATLDSDHPSQPDAKSDKKEEKIIISPYSLARELEGAIIPKFPDLHIAVEILGRTVEYNDIVLMKITKNSTKVMRTDDKFDDDDAMKRILFIVHGLSVMGFNQLPCMKNVDSMLILLGYYFEHLDLFDIYLMPMANPDGVSASAMKSFWNKNMSPQSACPGVALDRNFDIAFNESISNLGSCGQQYPGATAFSEVETQAIRDVFLTYGHKMIGYLNVHVGTYSPSIFKGDAVLYPRGFTDSTNDDDKYIDLRSEIEESLRDANFKVYSVTVDTLYSWYGKVYGTSVDYAAVAYGVPFSMELVMQLYEDDMMVEESSERETSAALTEVWRRIIRVMFPYMHRIYSKTNPGYSKQ